MVQASGFPVSISRKTYSLYRWVFLIFRYYFNVWWKLRPPQTKKNIDSEVMATHPIFATFDLFLCTFWDNGGSHFAFYQEDGHWTFRSEKKWRKKRGIEKKRHPTVFWRCTISVFFVGKRTGSFFFNRFFLVKRDFGFVWSGKPLAKWEKWAWCLVLN